MTKMIEEQAPSSATWATLDACARIHVQACIQPRREDELTELLGRPRSARRGVVDAPTGARNGRGKRRRLALMNGGPSRSSGRACATWRRAS